MEKVVRRGIRGHKKHRKRVRMIKLLTLFVVSSGAILLMNKAAAYYGRAEISISVQKSEILQDEELPEFKAEVTLEGSEKIVLDEEEDYRVEDLMENLENGEGYSLVTNADPAVEGDYLIKAVLDEEISEKLENEWLGAVEIVLKDAVFRVKNPLGEWDGNQFKRYDGTYVESEFVESLGSTYYLNAEGEKSTGWQNINGKQYLFSKLGIMQKNCWQNRKSDRYYFGKNGAALTGWQEIDGESYFFHQDGKMVTGDIYIGMSLCTFGEDGRFLSKKESDIDPDKPMVALTFDDGPGKRTEELLDCLEEYNAHATFFMLGTNIPRYADAVKKMKEIGCELGNHSYDHTNLSSLDMNGIKGQIQKTNRELKELVGTGATVMRPPYGAISSTMREAVDMPMILWNIDTLDWKTRNAQSTIDAVMNTVKDGDIILMHDIHSETIDAALKLIPMLQEEGYQLVTVSELAGAKDVKLEKGEKYTDF